MTTDTTEQGGQEEQLLQELAKRMSPQKSELDWEQLHAKVMGRLDDAPLGSSTELLRAPFPEAESERDPSPLSAPRALQAATAPGSLDDTDSLLSLAKATADKRAASKPASARDLLLEATQARRSSPELASELSSPVSATSVAPPSSAPTLSSSSAPAVPGVESGAPVAVRAGDPLLAQAPAADAAQAPSKPKRGSPSGLVIGFLGAAALFALWSAVGPKHGGQESNVVSRAPDGSAPSSGVVAESSAAKEVPPAEAALAVTASPTGATAAHQAEGAVGAVALNTPRAVTGAGAHEPLRAAKGAPLSNAAAEPSPKANLSKSPAPAPVVLAETARQEAPAVDPEEAPAPRPQAAPAPTPLQPAAAPTGPLPERPSVGALQAAVAPGLGTARRCVVGQSGPSTATVTFASQGHVTNVSVSGPAQGTPAEACVKGALTGARVQPFSRPEYHLALTVRP